MSYFAPYIDDTGLHMPTYEDRLDDLVSAYRSIFGVDAEMSESVPDYQLLSVLAKALDDTSALVLQAFNSRNPGYASGQGLDLLLPLYGITRENGEDDASVRARITGALAARGAGTLDAVEAAVKACRWVRDAKVYVNDTNATDSLGIPAHSLAAVIFAGDGPAVAKAICDTKAPGVGTYGNTYEDVTDAGRAYAADQLQPDGGEKGIRVYDDPAAGGVRRGGGDRGGYGGGELVHQRPAGGGGAADYTETVCGGIQRGSGAGEDVCGGGYLCECAGGQHLYAG